MPPVAPAFRQSAAPTSAYNRHIQTTAAQKHIYDNPPPDPVRIRTERDILEAHHRFLHPATAPEDEETALARAYYEKLFKEFAVMELSRWREGMVAMRWRTADEVKKGLGEKVCGSLRCGESEGLECREVDFKYQEKGKDERALVKVWVCEKCCRKLVRAQNGGKKEEKNNERHRHRRRRDEEHNSERSRSTTKRKEQSLERDYSSHVNEEVPKKNDPENTDRREGRERRHRRRRHHSRSMSPKGDDNKEHSSRNRHRHRHDSKMKE